MNWTSRNIFLHKDKTLKTHSDTSLEIGIDGQGHWYIVIIQDGRREAHYDLDIYNVCNILNNYEAIP